MSLYDLYSVQTQSLKLEGATGLERFRSLKNGDLLGTSTPEPREIFQAIQFTIWDTTTGVKKTSFLAQTVNASELANGDLMTKYYSSHGDSDHVTVHRFGVKKSILSPD
jgi:hypothetical protein